MGKIPVGWEYYPYLGNIVGSTGQPSSSRIGNVDLESLAIATQFLKNKIYIVIFKIDL
jgi:hypothetical protein